jgi:hypothetical protein
MTAAAARLAIRAVKRGRTVPILFDLSRLIARARHPTPTGIDRVDLAYAEALLGAERQVAFTGRLPGLGQFGFGRNHVARFVAATAARWADPDPAGAPLRHLLPGARRTAVMPAGSLRLIVAHQLLDRGDVLHRQLLRQQTRLAVFLHDAIPADYPEYARPGGDSRHRRRLATAAEFAAGIIVNSAATADSLSKFLGPAPPPLLVAPLGLTPRGTVQAPAPIRPCSAPSNPARITACCSMSGGGWPIRCRPRRCRGWSLPGAAAGRIAKFSNASIAARWWRRMSTKSAACPMRRCPS